MPDLRPRAAGFTLLELLVVIVIVGVMLTFASLSIGDGGQGARIENEARRLAALIGLAGEEAVLNGRELGLRFDEESYYFLRFEDGEWRPVGDDPQLRRRVLAADLAVQLVLEGLPVALGDEPEPLVPHLFLASSGERTPFLLEVGAVGALGLNEEAPRYRIQGAPMGPLEFGRVDSDRR